MKGEIVGSIGIGLPIFMRIWEWNWDLLWWSGTLTVKLFVSGAFCGVICKSVLYNGSLFWSNPLTLDSAVCYAGCPWNRWKICEDGEKSSLGPWSLRHSLQLWQIRFVLFWHFKMQVLRMQAATWYIWFANSVVELTARTSASVCTNHKPSQFAGKFNSFIYCNSYHDLATKRDGTPSPTHGGVGGSRSNSRQVSGHKSQLGHLPCHAQVTHRGGDRKLRTISAKEPRLDC